MPHFLSVDLEEWYHGTGLALTDVERSRQKSRAVPQTLRLLGIFKEYSVKATFFILGEVAVEHPGLVRAIMDEGHEIGLHGMSHRSLTELGDARAKDDILRGFHAVAEAAGAAPRVFRAPTWSIGPHNLGILDHLLDLGITIDSSVYPCRFPFHGMPGNPRIPYRLTLPSGRSILEVPPMTLHTNIAGLSGGIPVGGGFFLRCLPLAVTRARLKWAEHRSEPGLVYIHPWELDPDIPGIRASLPVVMVHRAGIPGLEARLRRVLEGFRFAPIGTAKGIHP